MVVMFEMVAILIRSLGFIGALYALRWLWRAFYGTIYTYKLATPKNLKQMAGAEWAVVTGATDGIGKAYALELASRGFDLILISRSDEKLKSTAREIEENFSVSVKTIPFDFSNPSAKAYESELLSRIQEPQIGVLVNNVGYSYEFPDRLDRVNGGLERLMNVAIINILPVTLLSAAILKSMVVRKRGVVVNLSSAAAMKPVYHWGVYSASKKYVSWLTNILRKDYVDTEIEIQTVHPMMVATKMSKLRPSLFVPDAREFACSALNSVGYVSETSGYFWHELQSIGLFQLLPEFVFDILTRRNAHTIKQKAQRKKLTKPE
ncbi:17beta-hydroxysteroid dehydrogenase [Aphelenchoides besseyi]|nr:17beta-hydroxysteroid dehydrogenase [Aphelenchoides besseyi]